MLQSYDPSPPRLRPTSPYKRGGASANEEQLPSLFCIGPGLIFEQFGATVVMSRSIGGSCEEIGHCQME